MKENKAYKLNKEKQPAEEKGKYLYYFYNDQKLSCIAVDENQWEKLVALDTEMYNNERRHDSHSANLSDDIQYSVDNNVEIIEKQDLTTSLSSLSDLDRLIYKYFLDGYTQFEISKKIGKSQSYIAKRLLTINKTIETSKLKEKDLSDDEIIVAKQWKKYVKNQTTDDNEDILWDMFRVITPIEIQCEIASWFYSYKEYCYFAIKYLVLKPYEKFDELEVGNRVNELPYEAREWFYDFYDDELLCFQGLFIAFMEEVEKKKRLLKKKPSDVNFERLIQKAEEISKRVDMSLDEYINERFIPMQAEKRSKRYADYVDNSYVYYVDENDPRPIEEQIETFIEHCKNLDKKFGTKIINKNFKKSE